MKKIRLVSLVLSGMMITGCMSLEERLQSNDPAVKREAEFELIRMSWGPHRATAIQRLTDEYVLASVAIAAKGASEKEGLLAVEKIKSDNYLSCVAVQAQSEKVAQAALNNVKDMKSIVGIAMTTKSVTVFDQVLGKCDQQNIVQIATNHPDLQLRSRAVERVEDEKMKKELGDKVVAELRAFQKKQSAAAAARILKQVRVVVRAPNGRCDKARNDALTQKLYQDLKLVSEVTDVNKVAEGCHAWRGWETGEDEKRGELFADVYLPERFAEVCKDPKDMVMFLTGRFWVGPSNALRKKIISSIKDEAELKNFTTMVKNDKKLLHEVYSKITDEAFLTKLVIDFKDDRQVDWSTVFDAIARIKNKEFLVSIALFANDRNLARKAQEKLGDRRAIQSAVIKLVKDGKIGNGKLLAYLKGLKNGEATVALYDSVSDSSIKMDAFCKLSDADRIAIRSRSKAKCEKLIAEAKQKASETFELGGFCLGMNILDADALVGYYFPNWCTGEGFADKEHAIRVLWVPQQDLALCRADNDGKVFEFNFGKNILKKFYKFDVQNRIEWASAYSKKTGFGLRFNQVRKDFSISDYGSGDFKTYRTFYNQMQWTYKHNVKGFRVTYYDDYNVRSSQDDSWDVLKKLTWERARYGVGGEPGSLRAKVDED